MTPRSISCPCCYAPIGKVCETYVEPDAASDLAARVPLYCADRIDAAFEQLADLLAECAEQTADGFRHIGKQAIFAPFIAKLAARKKTK